MSHVIRLAAALLLAAVSLPSFATTLYYRADLTGAAESPPNASPGTGWAIVTIDTDTMTMRVQVVFADLVGTTTASHIHCCTAVADTGNAGVATTTPTFPGFPLGVTSGTYDHTFDMTQAASYNAAFITAQGSLANAWAALLAGLAGGTSYYNIHTTFRPGGEIRGFLHEAPEPGSLLLMAAGLAALAFTARSTSGSSRARLQPGISRRSSRSSR